MDVLGDWSLWEVLVLEHQRTRGRLGGQQGWGWTGGHLVATSNLSLTVLTLQPLAPCFFRSVSQSSDVSRRGIGGFLEPELQPRAGGRHRGGERRARDSFSALLSAASLCFFRLYPCLTLKHPRSPALLRVIPAYCWAWLLRALAWTMAMVTCGRKNTPSFGSD